MGSKEICEILDKLLIRSLELTEESVKCRMNMEKLANNGNLDLAHTRYMKGANFVSSVQLPDEDYKEFNALASIKKNAEDECVNLQLEKHPVDKENDYIDPLRWFGILVPTSLQMARDKFSRSLDYVVEAANIQIELINTLCLFSKFNKMKKNLD